MITIIDDFLPEDLSLSLLGVFGDDVPAAEACLTVPYDRLDPRRPGVGPLRMAMHRTRLHVAEVVRSMLDLPRVEPESTCLRRVAPGFAPRVKPGAWWMVAQAVIALDDGVAVGARDGTTELARNALWIRCRQSIDDPVTLIHCAFDPPGRNDRRPVGPDSEKNSGRQGDSTAADSAASEDTEDSLSSPDPEGVIDPLVSSVSLGAGRDSFDIVTLCCTDQIAHGEL